MNLEIEDDNTFFAEISMLVEIDQNDLVYFSSQIDITSMIRVKIRKKWQIATSACSLLSKTDFSSARCPLSIREKLKFLYTMFNFR